MGEIRIVGSGKTRGYPYPVCKKRNYSVVFFGFRHQILSGSIGRSKAVLLLRFLIITCG